MDGRAVIWAGTDEESGTLKFNQVHTYKSSRLRLGDKKGKMMRCNRSHFDEHHTIVTQKTHNNSTSNQNSIMFQKFLFRRSEKAAEKKERRRIFRTKKQTTAKEDVSHPAVEQVLTMTLSEDSTDTTMAPMMEIHRASSIVQDEERLITFTETQVLQNALIALNQGRQLTEAHQEVDTMKKVLEELKSTHAQKFAEKEQALISAQRESVNMKAVLEELKTVHSAKLAEKEMELASTKCELIEVKMELSDTKEELVKVSSVLIGCQHELHELTEKPWRAFWCA